MDAVHRRKDPTARSGQAQGLRQKPGLALAGEK
jgi:hypothetical protein